MEEHAQSVAVVGGGPAGLMAATVLVRRGLGVDLYDAMPSVGRKFLIAGRGGLNLTHSEPLDRFVARYLPDPGTMSRHVRAYDPEAWRGFVHDLGVATFVGTSGRVFPVDFKAAPLLRAWVQFLRERGVRFHVRHRLAGLGAGTLEFDAPQDRVTVQPRASVLALGGASWPHLGSDGGWVGLLDAHGVEVRPLVPSNCGFETDWSPVLRERFAGAPLKNVALRFEGRTARGEMVVADYGIEGGAVYALSAQLRDAIARDGEAVLRVDLKPDLTEAQVAERLARPQGGATLARHLQKTLGLGGPVPALLREAGVAAGDAATLAGALKGLPLVLRRPRPIAEAISSGGGVAFAEVTDGLMLRRLPGVFLAGEMLDWEAPTGGYLLQGCVATGAAAGEGAARWLRDGLRVSVE